MRSSRRWARRPILGVVLASVLVLSLSHDVQAAEPSAADIESGKALYKAGKELRDAGDLRASLEKLKSAYAIAPTPITGMEVGRAYALLGRFLEAREAYLAVGRLPKRPDESEKARAARSETERLATEIEPRLGSLSVTFRPPAPTDLKVTIDDEDVPIAALSVPRKVNPGKHRLAATSGTARGSADATVAEGQNVPVEVELVPVASTAPPPQKAEAPGPLPATTTDGPANAKKTRTNKLVYIGGGIAAVGAAVGTVTGLLAFSRVSTAKEHCVDLRCPPESHGDIDASLAMGTVSTIAFAVAGGGVAIAIYGLLSPVRAPHSSNAHDAHRARVATRVVPSLGSGWAGVAGTF